MGKTNLGDYLNKKKLRTILYLSLFIKIILIFYIGDESFVEEWKILLSNLKNFQSLSFYAIDGYRLVPSVYMPPLYTFFLYFFYFLANFNDFLAVKIILIFQCVLSIITAQFFYHINRIYFSEKLSVFLTLIFFFYPLHFYASTQISSITLQVFLFIMFVYFFLQIKHNKSYIYFGIISACLVLIRGEFLILFIICLIAWYFEVRKLNKILISILITFILITPYIIRNYNNFGQFVITKSFGFNLWRGNNVIADLNGTIHPEWTYPNLTKEKSEILNYLKKDNKIYLYEIYIDDNFKKRAINNIKNDPIYYFNLYLKKLFSFVLYNYNSNYPKYYNPLVVAPEIIYSFLGLIGFIINFMNKKKLYKVTILYLFYIFLIPTFFILPRYKLFILPLIIIFIGIFIKYILSNKNSFKKTI